MVPNLSYPLIFSVISIASVATAALLWLILPLLQKNMPDIPNNRSMHQKITPRGGGIAILIVLITMLVAMCLKSSVLSSPPLLMWVGMGTALLGILGFLDDKYTLPALLKLSIQLAAVLTPVLFIPTDQFLLSGIVPLWLDRLVLILGWLWFLNLYNFMDGIDGITGVQTVSLGFGIFIIASILSLPLWLGLMGLILTGIAIGFLIWNWPPARVFMGDVGSIPLGYCLGFCLIQLALLGYPLIAFILPLYYTLDATITLILRARKGYSPLEPHRSHAYQHSVANGRSVSSTILSLAALNAILLGLTVMLATQSLPFTMSISLLSIAFSLSLCLFLYFYRPLKQK